VKIWSAILTGVGELLGHKLRSLLTMLGVIFGIGSVIAMVSIGAGARQEALEEIKLMGINVIQVNRKSVSSDLARQAEKDSPNGLTYGDALAIKDLYPAAQLVVPACRVVANVQAGGKMIPAKVFGTTGDFSEASRVQIADGRFLDAGDLTARSLVCVIGGDVKREAFAFENPVGRLINLGGRDFRVIGVMAERSIQAGRSRFALRDMNQDIYLPVTIALDDFQIYVEQAVPSDVGSFRHLLDRMMRRPPMEGRSVTQIIVQVADEQQTFEAAHVARRVLDRRHKEIPDYDIVIPAELLRQSQQTQRIFNIVMGAIASISLLVGGIGIMNIMLATVTQRQREIGIRRCIGASRADIIRQFLIECLVITIVGGLIGVVMGVEMARLISTYAKWPTVVSGQAILLSLAVASITGVVFGLYPATRAASIQPVEALRSG
jgi:putative ABC transport system permease protein